jgi:hypothetical protein
LNEGTYELDNISIEEPLEPLFLPNLIKRFPEPNERMIKEF